MADKHLIRREIDQHPEDVEGPLDVEFLAEAAAFE